MHFEYTFWNKKTKDALINVLLSPSSAHHSSIHWSTSARRRAGDTKCRFSAQLYESRRFGWDVLVTGSHFSNKVVDLGIDPSTGLPRILRTASQGGEVRKIPGFPINSQWYHPYTYKDVNDDGILQSHEVQVDRRGSTSAIACRVTSSRCRTASISSWRAPPLGDLRLQGWL